jgi:hypothetical protein
VFEQCTWPLTTLTSRRGMDNWHSREKYFTLSAYSVGVGRLKGKEVYYDAVRRFHSNLLRTVMQRISCNQSTVPTIICATLNTLVITMYVFQLDYTSRTMFHCPESNTTYLNNVTWKLANRTDDKTWQSYWFRCDHVTNYYGRSDPAGNFAFCTRDVPRFRLSVTLKLRV